MARIKIRDLSAELNDQMMTKTVGGDGRAGSKRAIVFFTDGIPTGGVPRPDEQPDPSDMQNPFSFDT